MEASRVIFYGFLLIFCVDCAISGDDAVRKLLDALGIEKDLKDLDAEERAVVIGRTAERFLRQSNKEMEQRLETLEVQMAIFKRDIGEIDTKGAVKYLEMWQKDNAKRKLETAEP